MGSTALAQLLHGVTTAAPSFRDRKRTRRKLATILTTLACQQEFQTLWRAERRNRKRETEVALGRYVSTFSHLCCRSQQKLIEYQIFPNINVVALSIQTWGIAIHNDLILLNIKLIATIFYSLWNLTAALAPMASLLHYQSSLIHSGGILESIRTTQVRH